MTQSNRPPDIYEILRRMQETITLLSRRRTSIPQYDTPPANPSEGEIWITNDKLYVHSGGTTKTYSPDA